VPVYQYACTECGEQLEVRQSFTDDALTVCPACAGRLRKVLSAVGVVFKGSGFYRTDSRTATKEQSGSSTTSNGSSEKSDATPAAVSTTSANGNGSSSNGSGDSASSGSRSSDGTSAPSTPSPATTG
jgi:putative FmdB family regulatory protein